MMGRAKGHDALFLGDVDRSIFLAGLTEVVLDLGWNCLAYCLMTTHYHLLVQTPTGGLSRGMRCLNGDYAKSYNRRHDGRGHVFGDRYKREPIRRETHLMEALRYIALNPVRARLVGRPEDWRWGSHAFVLDRRCAPAPVACDLVLELFGGAEPEGRARYRRFVEDGMADARASVRHRDELCGAAA